MNRASDLDADSSVSNRQGLSAAKTQRRPENLWLTWLASLSFANLVYLRAWSNLIPNLSGDVFLRKTIPGFSLYFAVLGDVLALSLLILLTIRIAPGLPRLFRQALPALAVATVVLMIVFAGSSRQHFVPRKYIPVAAILVSLGAGGLAYLAASGVTRALRAISIAAIPCIAVTFLAPLYYLNMPSPLPPDPALAPRLAGIPPVRVLWIIFDEWDQRLTFTNRNPGTLLPALDRLARSSFFATNARAVQSDAGKPVDQMLTFLAIPSLLYARHVTDLTTLGNGTARISFAGGDQSTLFGGGQSVFARARFNGWNTAAAGWYLPYCRAFSQQLSDCYWDELYARTSNASHSPVQGAVDETRMLFETYSVSPFGPTLTAVRHFAEYNAILRAARGYATDPSIALTFVHFNIPHLPFFYNPKIGRFQYYGYRPDLYGDALQWVDNSIDEIFKSLRSAGLDSKTAIILSSDHPERQAPQTDPHVPFIVHLPGQETGTVYSREFSTIKTADLALAIIGGSVQSSADIERFLR